MESVLAKPSFHFNPLRKVSLPDKLKVLVIPPRVRLRVSDVVQDYGLVQGDWWTVYGQSCGQVDSHGDWGGAHDWVPCSHARFLKLEDGDWINNTTFCVGSDSVCTVCIRAYKLPHIIWEYSSYI